MGDGFIDEHGNWVDYDIPNEVLAWEEQQSRKSVELGIGDIIAGNLPMIENLSDIYEENPEYEPEVIKDVLRIGQKMLIVGGSKIGKSWALIDLTIAGATGTKWMGLKCVKGKILYINMELDRSSCSKRFRSVLDKKTISESEKQEALKNISIWNLRGYISPLDTMIKDIIAHCKDKNFTMIILDPIYKVLTGDENNATAMTQFTNLFDQITTELGVATVYAHHHSKGNQTNKSALDRMSGSGVFARDPDAILDFTEIQTLETERRAFKMEFAALRNFKPQSEKYIWFEYPTFHEDEIGVMKAHKLYQNEVHNKKRRVDAEVKAQNKQDRETNQWKERLRRLDEAFVKHRIEGKANLNNVRDELNIKDTKTLHSWLDKFEFYEYSKGKGSEIWRNYE